MTLQIIYGKNFEEEWERLRGEALKVLEDNGCIDEELNIVWPCWVCIQKREKERRQH